MSAIRESHLVLRAAGPLLVGLGLIVAVGGCGRSGGPETRPVGSLRVGVETAPAVPAVGENTMRVRAETADGKPLRGAAIDAVVFMPAMGSMPYMESRPPLKETKPGVYEGDFRLSMGGSWDIDVTVKPENGSPARAALRLTVGAEGLTWVTETDDEAEGTGDGQAGAMDTPADGAVRLSARRRQEIGVTTARVERRDLTHERRVVGRVVPDETRVTDVNLRFSGWVRTVEADFTGAEVRVGQILFTLYSPELYAAEREYVEALEAIRRLEDHVAQQRAKELAESARQRLLLWGVSESEIAEIERLRVPRDERPVRAPVSGTVLEKNLVAGAKVEAGTLAYRIAPLDPIWVLADVYQYELPLFRVGQAAGIRLPYGDEAAIPGGITYVYPYLAGESRTGSIRLEVSNPNLQLKPEMFVDVQLEIRMEDALAIPHSSVIVSGERRLVFVDRGGGWLEPRQIRVGARAGEYDAVVDGLEEGETVVTSGNFLISAESRLRAAAERF